MLASPTVCGTRRFHDASGILGHDHFRPLPTSNEGFRTMGDEKNGNFSTDASREALGDEESRRIRRAAPLLRFRLSYRASAMS
ncbi:hypothetical protein B5F40_10045 [Gordonibacter sp. An230]|nr:hypothetical protein B5F40_10045 [Gordonibacter sp. An230]